MRYVVTLAYPLFQGSDRDGIWDDERCFLALDRNNVLEINNHLLKERGERNLFYYLRIFAQDCLFSSSQTVINESPVFVAKHLQRNPMAMSSERLLTIGRGLKPFDQ